MSRSPCVLCYANRKCETPCIQYEQWKVYVDGHDWEKYTHTQPNHEYTYNKITLTKDDLKGLLT